MSIIVTKAKNDIKTIILEAAKKAMENGQLCSAELTDFTVEVPQNRSHGDYAINISILHARSAKEAPRLMAKKIIKEIDKDSLGAEKVELEGPGFINGLVTSFQNCSA